jgi:hypothetical protein
MMIFVSKNLGSINVSFFKDTDGIGLSNSDILIMDQNNSSYLLRPIPSRSRTEDPEGIKIHKL